jgi:hypothetical protein
MFNRSEIGSSDCRQLSEVDLIRFKNDEYVTRYLIGCYNPEYNVIVRQPKKGQRFSHMVHASIGGRVNIKGRTIV